MSKSKIERTVEVPSEIIRELLTESEWRMVKTRLLIISLLKEGLSVRKIAGRAKVGTDTVVRISKKLKSSLSLKRLISGLSNEEKEIKWIFGHSLKD